MHHFTDQSLLGFSPYIYRHTYLLHENILPYLSFQNCVCRSTLFFLMVVIIRNMVAVIGLQRMRFHKDRSRNPFWSGLGADRK